MIRSAEILQTLGPALPSEGLEIAPNPLRELVRVSAVRPGLYTVSFFWITAWVEAESAEAALWQAERFFWRQGARPGMSEEDADRLLGSLHPALRKP